MHHKISDDGIPTPLVSPFAWKLVEHWAKLFKDFVQAPLVELCPFSAHTDGQKPRPQLPASKALKQFLRASRAFELGDDTDTSGTDSKVFFKNSDFVMGRSEAVLRVTIGSKQLGARKKKNRHHHKNIRNFSPEELRAFEDPSTEPDSDEVLNKEEFVKIVQDLLVTLKP